MSHIVFRDDCLKYMMSTRGDLFSELRQFFERVNRQFTDATRMWEADGPLARWTTDTRAMAIALVNRAYVVFSLDCLLDQRQSRPARRTEYCKSRS